MLRDAAARLLSMRAREEPAGCKWEINMTEMRTSPDEEAPPRWAADLLADAHTGMELWRLCEHRDCRRRRACTGKADPCGMYLAPRAWAWVREAVKALREGASPRLAAWAAGHAEPR